MRFKGMILALGLALSITAYAGFDEGKAAYDKQDYATALQELRPLAEQGDAKAQLHLGIMYDSGFGVPQDYAQAINWLRQAAERDADAQRYLGARFDYSQDYAQAASWYRKAAEQGDAKAQSYLASIYQKGKGVPQDYTQSVRWYRKAAEQGLAGAQVNLGAMYYYGQGVPQSYVEAASWLRKAAEQGTAIAQTNLGNMYVTGKGIERNLVLACMLFNIAVASGYNDATLARSGIIKQLSSTQLREAESLAAAWKINTPLPAKSTTENTAQ